MTTQSPIDENPTRRLSQVEWTTRCLTDMRDEGLNRIEASLEAENGWVKRVNALAAQTLFPVANSWYMGANIPDKPRVFMPYVGGIGTYRRKCDEVASASYRGFARSVA